MTLPESEYVYEFPSSRLGSEYWGMGFIQRKNSEVAAG